MIDYIGYVAAFLTTISFVPQVIKIYRSRSAHDVSLYMFILFTIGICMWLAYGVLQMMWPVILANAVTLVLSLSILIMKVKYD
jgi:MtN3 and saliva related transmembrane protein